LTATTPRNKQGKFLAAAKSIIFKGSKLNYYETTTEALQSRARHQAEAPGRRRELAALRDRIRLNEAQLAKLGSDLRGLADTKIWGRMEAMAREEMAVLRKTNASLADQIEAMEEGESEPGRVAVSPGVIDHHRRLVHEARANVSRIATALADAQQAIIALAPPDLGAIRQELQTALAAHALGDVEKETVDAIEARLADAEAAADLAAAAAGRNDALTAGLGARLASAEGELAAMEAIGKLIRQAVIDEMLLPAQLAAREALAAFIEAFDKARALRSLATPAPELPGLDGLKTAGEWSELMASVKDPGAHRLQSALDAIRNQLPAF
jgi:protein required for attachment to host cells